MHLEYLDIFTVDPLSLAQDYIAEVPNGYGVFVWKVDSTFWGQETIDL